MPEQDLNARTVEQVNEAIPAASRPVLPGDYGMPSSTEGVLPWSRVIEQMLSAKNYWVVTAGQDGRPHAVPVWAAWLDGVLYFDGHPQTRWARNLARNPQIAVHLESGDHVVILEGTVSDMPSLERGLAERVSNAFKEKYDYAPSADDFVNRGLFLLKPSLVLAWDEFPTSLTRWQLG